MKLRARWTSLTPPARVVLLVWLATILFGMYELLLISQWNIADARLQPDELRLKAWGPIYAFARACAARVPTHASILLLDPTDRVTSAANYALAPDLDLDDVRAFEYVMYPRGITGLGHLARDWAPVAAGADYVAVWAPTENRSATALAQAQQAEAALRQSSPSDQACTYQDPRGNRGSIFAVSQVDAPAPPARVQAGDDPATGWMTYARTLLGLASLWIIGAVILHVLSRAGWTLGPALVGSLAFPLGCLAITLELLFFSLVGITWQLVWLALPWCALGVWVLAARGRTLGIDLARLVRETANGLARSPTWDERLATILLGSLALGVAVAAVANLPQSDGFHFTYFQAHAFFVDESVTPYYARAAELVFTANAHPPLVPLSVTWLYLVNGGLDEQPTLLLWPAWWLCLLGGFYVFARSAVVRRAAVWCTLMFAIVSYDLSAAAFGRAPDAPNRAGFADLPLASYLFLAAGLLWSEARHTRQSFRVPVLATLLLVAAGMTKEEGSVAALVTIAATPLLGIYRDTRGLGTHWWQPVVSAAPVFVIGMLPWAFVRVHYALPEMIVQANRSAAVLLQAFPVSIQGVLTRTVPRWVLPGTVLVAAWLSLGQHRKTASPELLSGRTWFLLSITAVQLAADTAALTLGPNEIHVELVQGAQRLLLQLAALPFLAATEFVPLLFGWSRAHHVPGIAEGYAQNRPPRSPGRQPRT